MVYNTIIFEIICELNTYVIMQVYANHMHIYIIFLTKNTTYINIDVGELAITYVRND